MLSTIKDHIEQLLSKIIRKNDLHQMIFDLNRLKDKISYKNVIHNGVDDREQLRILATKEIQNIVSETLKKYLTSLLAKDDLSLFEPAHLKTFAEEFEIKALKTDFIEITSAVEIKPEDVSKIAENLSTKIGRKIIVDIRTNENIVGGAIIKKDNYIIDFSIQTKLLNLAERWKGTLAKSRK